MKTEFEVRYGLRSTVVEMTTFPGRSVVRFKYKTPGCGCQNSYTAELESNIENIDMDLILKDLKSFLSTELFEYKSMEGKILTVNYCKWCGSKLPPIEYEC